MATAEFSKFAGILSAALSQHHLSGFEIHYRMAKGTVLIRLMLRTQDGGDYPDYLSGSNLII